MKPPDDPPADSRAETPEAPPGASASGLSPKAARTRAHILETALRVLRERGYEGATMRLIAEEAGVAVGSAYYYFPSKDHLIQGFYAQLHVDHLAAVGPLLEGSKSLDERLAAVMRTKFETAAPYHGFSGALFKTAADPDSPLSPFSADSGPTRDESKALFRSVVDGAGLRKRSPLHAKLHELLWLYQMGLILYWIHDRSPGQERSYRLVDRTVPIVCRLVRLASNPLLTPVVKPALALMEEFCGPAPRAHGGSEPGTSPS